MVIESSGAATKALSARRAAELHDDENNLWLYEGHEVDDGQLCCTKSSRAATKELQSSYEYNENSVSSWRLAAFRTTKLSSLPYTPRVFFVAACRPSLFQKESSPKTRGFTFVTLDLSYIFFVSPPVVNHLVDDAPIGKSAYPTVINV